MKVSIVSILMGILCTFSAQAPNPSVEDTTGLTETTISETTISANTEKDPQLSLDSSPGSSANINKGDNSEKNQTPEISMNLNHICTYHLYNLIQFTQATISGKRRMKES